MLDVSWLEITDDIREGMGLPPSIVHKGGNYEENMALLLTGKREDEGKHRLFACMIKGGEIIKVEPPMISNGREIYFAFVMENEETIVGKIRSKDTCLDQEGLERLLVQLGKDIEDNVVSTNCRYVEGELLIETGFCNMIRRLAAYT